MYFSIFTNYALKVLLIKKKKKRFKLEKIQTTHTPTCVVGQHYPQVSSSIALVHILSADSSARTQNRPFAL